MSLVLETVCRLNFDISSSNSTTNLEILPSFTPDERQTFNGKQDKVNPGTGHEGPEGE